MSPPGQMATPGITQGNSSKTYNTFFKLSLRGWSGLYLRAFLRENCYFRFKNDNWYDGPLKKSFFQHFQNHAQTLPLRYM